eukprot:GEMP01029687.1.p1 GENE.GEMP01029687.1~~GEMP01029687.1.p1  ORF type:complete len:217 (+),score=42.35 GEMP01029687.1:316-966(+)
MQQAGGGHVQLPRNIHEIQQLYASMGGAVPQNIPESSAYATFQNDLNATCAAAEGDDNRWMAHWVSLQVMPQAVLCRVLDATDSDAYDISKTRLWRKVLRAIGHAVESATVAGLEQFNDCKSAAMAKLFIIMPARLPGRPGTCVVGGIAKGQCVEITYYHDRAATSSPRHMCGGRHGKSAALAGLRIAMPVRLPFHLNTCLVGDCKRTIMSKLRIT